MNTMSDAISVENLDFSYGKNQILRGYNSKIKYSQIYSLLGPSGGGKTTLLKLMLGRLKIQSGKVTVLGLPPGVANSSISFMPQEVGLCTNFTINQTLRYFKLIYQISNEDFYIRRKTLSDIVNLPDGDMLVSQLSGGTKRRLSIVIALINNPRLVILDEPTVGIDALLRNQIWDYLVSQSRQGMSIIIVTHYIEEAANSDRVGLMRNGRLLAEGNPKLLMSMYNEPNLEAVFLKLCCFDDKINAGNTDFDTSSNPKNVSNYVNYSVPYVENHDPNNNQILPHSKPKFDQYSIDVCNSRHFDRITQNIIVKLWILYTLVYKNLIKFFYSYFSIIIILLPATQALIYCAAISKQTIHLKTAVFDQEPEPGYGHDIISNIQTFRSHLIQPIMFKSLENAKQAVINREVIGAIWIPENYTDSIDQRIEEGFLAENSTIDGSTIRVFMDNSIFLYGIEFGNSLLDSFSNFSKTLLKAKNLSTIVSPFDIEMTELSKNYKFSDYYMPGYFLLFMYISQITVASLTLTQERKDGLFERSLIGGVSHELVFISHIITSFSISLVQIILLNFTAFHLFDNIDNGNLWLKFMFLSLVSLNAMSLGFLISALIDNEMACIILVWFITIPQILCSGVFWPLESLKEPFVQIFYMCPLSIPIKTIRHIMLQGFDLNNSLVQFGFLSCAIPMIFFFFFSLIIFRRK